MRPRIPTDRQLRWISLWILMAGIVACETSTAAEPPREDGHALAALFGEPQLAENVHDVRRRARKLPLEEGYRFLCRWVMPGGEHSGIRLAGDFTPCDPPPINQDAKAAGHDAATLAHQQGQSTMQGGELVSPAFDLVDVARALGRLDELAACLTPPDGAESKAADHQQARARIALLFLIRLAQNDEAAAKEAFGKLFDLFRESDHVDAWQRWPETLALARGVAHTATREVAGELLYVLYDMYAADRRGWRIAGTHDWDHWFFSTFGAHKFLQAGHSSLEHFATRPRLANWIPAGYVNVRTRGIGLPRPHWEWNGEQLVKLSGHAKDYLYYRIPLGGEFEIECDLTPAAWRTTELLLGGVWISPYWHRKGAAWGTLRDERPLSELEQHVTEADEWARYRAVVRDGVCTIWVNGLRVYQQPWSGQSAPWLAIRSEARSHSGVRDLRITGNPAVPEQIELAANPDLPGWTPYQDYRVGPKSAWRHSTEFSEQGGIEGRHNAALKGAIQESLLRYHRPMLEDGTIEYEFYYDPGGVGVHPAIDRLALLIEPRGVDVHWITDDKYDRTALDPANGFIEPDNRRGSGPLPLHANEWNRLRLTLRGDTVELELNGQLIYQRVLEPTNQRTFGLFHYADQTAARVRNLVWRGAWPRELPPVTEQELTLPEHKCLEGLETLEEVFSHDFAASGAPAESFEITGLVAQQAVAFKSDGLQIVPVVRESHFATGIEYRQPIYGDFDATLRFEDLNIIYGSRGVIGLEFCAEDDTGVIVASARLHREKNRISATAKMSIPLPDNTRRYSAHHSADESDAGTLRLVRRGATVHALLAHGDSQNFRHLGSHRLPAPGTAVHLRPQLVSVAGAKVGVLLKQLTVRSNSAAILKRIDPRVASLNQFTLGLPAKFRHDFATSAAEGFVTSGSPVVVGSDGLQLRGKEGANATPSSLILRRGMQEDFDIATTFEELQLPQSADSSAKLELVIPIAGDKPSSARLSVVRAQNGKFKLTAQVQPGRSAKPDTLAQIATAESDSVDGLRAIRIQQTLFFLYSTNGFYQLLAMTDIPPGDVKPESVQLEISASGDAEAKVLLQAMELRAAKLVE